MQTLFKVNQNQRKAVPYLPYVIEVTGGWVLIPNEAGATTADQLMALNRNGEDQQMILALGEKALQDGQFVTDEDGDSYLKVFTESDSALRHAVAGGYLDEADTFALVALEVCSLDGGHDSDVKLATAEKLISLGYQYRAGLSGAYLVRGI